MGQKRDYHQPRNRELRHLLETFPLALKVRTPDGRLLWQNSTAERDGESSAWRTVPVTWQSERAELSLPELIASSDAGTERRELEGEVERIKRQQRRTARRKRTAEQAQMKADRERLAEQRRREKLEQRLSEMELELRRETALRQAAEAELEKLREDALAEPDGEHGGERFEELNAELTAARETGIRLRDELDALQREKLEQQTDFEKFRQEVEAADAERELEEELRQKVEEFERLEEQFELEQGQFTEQKRKLEEALGRQEQELDTLQQRLDQRASGGEESGPSSLELEELQERIRLAEERERRTRDRLQRVEETKKEQTELLTMLREDLGDSRHREKELQETLKLYSEYRVELERARARSEELEAEGRRLQGRLEELDQEMDRLRARPPRGEDGPQAEASRGALDPLKSQVELLQSRLRETESALDKTRAELRAEQSKAEAAKETEKLAFQDSLTGLPNRHIVARYLAFARKQIENSGLRVALFMIDLDGYRLLRQTIGKEQGDRLLGAVGQRLDGMKGPNHVVARAHEDRFLLLAADLRPEQLDEFVSSACRSLLEAMAYPYDLDGEAIACSATIGVAAGEIPEEGFPKLYRRAEMALDRAKRHAPGTALVYRESILREAQQEKTSLKQMSLAAERGEFVPYFQPVVDLKSRRVIGLELLLRWQHRDGELLTPDRFLPLAVSSGQIGLIARSVWSKAFRKLAALRTTYGDLRLGLNLSARELLDPSLAEWTAAAVREVGLSPSVLTFEVRDGSRLRVSPIWWSSLGRLAEAGFGLCLDDFGSDSSLFGTLSYEGFTQAKVTIDERALWCPVIPAALSRVAICAKGVAHRYDPRGLLKAGFHQAQGNAIAPALSDMELETFLTTKR